MSIGIFTLVVQLYNIHAKSKLPIQLRRRHSCLSEKYRMGAPQWGNKNNQFIMTIFDCTMNVECVGGTWWSPRKYLWWLLVISAKFYCRNVRTFFRNFFGDWKAESANFLLFGCMSLCRQIWIKFSENASKFVTPMLPQGKPTFFKPK